MERTNAVKILDQIYILDCGGLIVGGGMRDLAGQGGVSDKFIREFDNMINATRNVDTNKNRVAATRLLNLSFVKDAPKFKRVKPGEYVEIKDGEALKLLTTNFSNRRYLSKKKLEERRYVRFVYCLFWSWVAE